MTSGNGYKTKQREVILSYLESTQSRHVTIDEVLEYLRGQGEKVGRTTIYRYMEKLTSDGKLRKYYIEEGMGACYQYMPAKQHCNEHFHLKCTGCKALIHAECEYLSDIERHVLTHHHFTLDYGKTVFYGVCEGCKSAGQTERE